MQLPSFAPSCSQGKVVSLVLETVVVSEAPIEEQARLLTSHRELERNIEGIQDFERAG